MVLASASTKTVYIFKRKQLRAIVTPHRIIAQKIEALVSFIAHITFVYKLCLIALNVSVPNNLVWKNYRYKNTLSHINQVK